MTTGRPGKVRLNNAISPVKINQMDSTIVARLLGSFNISTPVMNLTPAALQQADGVSHQLNQAYLLNVVLVLVLLPSADCSLTDRDTERALGRSATMPIPRTINQNSNA